MKRLVGIDLLKAVAMVMVVSLHINGRGGYWMRARSIRIRSSMESARCFIRLVCVA